jgi:hypothetical protein
MIGSEAERRNFGLQLGRQVHSRISGRLEQFGDQAVSPIALTFVVCPVTGCGRFEVGQLRLQRLDAFLECGDPSPVTSDRAASGCISGARPVSKELGAGGKADISQRLPHDRDL